MNQEDAGQPEWPAELRGLMTAALQLGLPLPAAPLEGSPGSPQRVSAPARMAGDRCGKTASLESQRKASSGKLSPAASAQEQEAEYWRQRRRMTNRESAQRVRRRKQVTVEEAQKQVEQVTQAHVQLQQAHAGACQLVGQLRSQVAHWQGQATMLAAENGGLKRRLAAAEAQLAAGPSAPKRVEPPAWPAWQPSLDELPSLSSAAVQPTALPAPGLAQLPGSLTSDLTSLQDMPATYAQEQAPEAVEDYAPMLQLAGDISTGACFQGLGALDDWDSMLGADLL